MSSSESASRLSDPDPRARVAAADAVERGDAATLTALTERVEDAAVVDLGTSPLGPTYVTVGERAVEALARIEAVDALVATLRSEARFNVPEPCHDQGIYIGDYASIDVYPAARAAAALARLGDARVLPALAEAARRPEEPVRHAAQDAVSKLAAEAGVEAEQALLTFLEEPEAERRRVLVGKARGPGAPALARRALEDPHPDVRAAACWSASLALEADEARAILVARLRGGTSPEQRTAAGALRHVPLDDHAEAALLDALDHRLLRESAEATLAHHRRAAAAVVPRLVSRLNETGWWNAVDRLADYGAVAAAAIPALEAKAAGAHPSVRDRIARALAKIRGEPC